MYAGRIPEKQLRVIAHLNRNPLINSHPSSFASLEVMDIQSDYLIFLPTNIPCDE